jgi:CRISPR-associated protein Csd2
MLNNKYDFKAILSVKNANPNGDPLNGNRPRINYEGIGEISDVCIKRKIRNRWMQNGLNVFVQSDDNRLDEYTSLRSRAEGVLKKDIIKDNNKLRDEACQKWIDVRAFGQVFAFSGGEMKGVSVGIRGPVSIHSAFSLNPININSIQITKSVNSEGDGGKKSSDTMGMKHRVEFGVYTFVGSINPQLASKTGFNDDDAEAVRKALLELFEDDASSARPDGSMEIIKLYWWKHNNKNGQYSSAKVHRSIDICLKEGIKDPRSINDYNIIINKLDDLELIEYSGK